MTLMWNVISKKHWFETNPNGAMIQYICKSMFSFVCVCVSVQSILFGIYFIFRDAPAEGNQHVEAHINGSVSTKGLHTTVDKNDELNRLGGYLTENDLLDKEVILYGEIPAIAYIYDLQPAIYTTWAELAFNTLEKLEKDLTSEELYQKKPLVIVTAEVAKRFENASELEQDKKLNMIFQYMEKFDYKNTYSGTQFYVYEMP